MWQPLLIPKGIEDGCECVPHDPITTALENQNSLPDEREEKHPAFSLVPI